MFRSVVVCAIALASFAVAEVPRVVSSVQLLEDAPAVAKTETGLRVEQSPSARGGILDVDNLKMNQQASAALETAIGSGGAGASSSVDRKKLAMTLETNLAAYPGLASRIYAALDSMPDSALLAYAAKHSEHPVAAKLEEASPQSATETVADVHPVPSSRESEFKAAIVALQNALADSSAKDLFNSKDDVDRELVSPAIPHAPADTAAAPTLSRADVEVAADEAVDGSVSGDSVDTIQPIPRLQLRLPKEVRIDQWLSWGLLDGIDYDIIPSNTLDDITFHVGHVDPHLVAADVLYLATTPSFTALSKRAVDAGFNQTTNCGQVCWDAHAKKHCIPLFDLMELSLRAASNEIVFHLPSGESVRAESDAARTVSSEDESSDVRSAQDGGIVLPMSVVAPYSSIYTRYEPMWWLNP